MHGRQKTIEKRTCISLRLSGWTLMTWASAMGLFPSEAMAGRSSVTSEPVELMVVVEDKTETDR